MATPSGWLAGWVGMVGIEEQVLVAKELDDTRKCHLVATRRNEEALLSLRRRGWSAAKALQMGLVHELVPEPGFDGEVDL